MITIGERSVTYHDVYEVAVKGVKLKLGEQARVRITQAREAVDSAVRHNEIIYGITTGFGAFKNKAIAADEVRQLQENLILSHAVGVGEPFDESVVRGMMYVMASYLSQGYSGVRVEVVSTLIEMLNKKVHPVVPEQGSVGSSGDLAPSAHIILVLIGKGEANYKGKKMTGDAAMTAAGIAPITLEAKEGLALINNTSCMCAVSALALHEVERLLHFADVCGALSVEALRGTTKAFDERIHSIKPHQGQIDVATNLRSLLKDSLMVDNSRIQDQYSLRCMPQIHGAVRESIKYVEGIVTTELNSVTDNPLIFQEQDGKYFIVSGGNFHGEPVAIAMDSLAIAISELANISDRRIASLLDPATNNGLPAFLAEKGGLHSGFMILQYTTAALASENKILAHPASVDSIPTSANVEDLVSMGTIAARKARKIAQNVRNVLAIELLVSCQGIDFRIKQGLKLGVGTEKVYSEVRAIAPYFSADSVYYPYVQKLADFIDNYTIIR